MKERLRLAGCDEEKKKEAVSTQCGTCDKFRVVPATLLISAATTQISWTFVNFTSSWAVDLNRLFDGEETLLGKAASGPG